MQNFAGSSAGNRRKKRQVAEVLSGLSLAASIYNGVRINQIQSQMGKLNSLVDSVVASIETQSEKINELTEKLERCFQACTRALVSIQQRNAQEQLTEFLHTITMSANSILVLLNSFELGIEKLSLGRLSPFFVTQKAVKDSWKNLKESARKQGLLVSGQDEKVLFNSEAATFTIKGLPYFIIEVPLSPAKQTFSIYEYMDSPVSLKNMTFHFRPQNRYLVIDELKAVSREISTAEFNTCKRIGELYHCKFEKVYSRGMNQQPSCLIRLFNSKFDDISFYCPVIVDAENMESVAEISLNRFKIHSHIGTTVNLDCKNTSLSKQIAVKGTTIVDMPANNCQGSTPNFIFFGTLTLLTQSDLFDSHSIFTHEQLLGFELSTQQDMHNLAVIIKQLKKEKPLQELNVNEIRQRFHEKQMAVLNSVRDYRMEIYVGAFLLFIGIIIPCCVVYRRRRKYARRTRYAQDDGTSHEKVTINLQNLQRPSKAKSKSKNIVLEKEDSQVQCQLTHAPEQKAIDHKSSTDSINDYPSGLTSLQLRQMHKLAKSLREMK